VEYLQKIQAMKFEKLVKPEVFEKIKQLTSDILKSMLDVVDNVCGDQKLDIDHYWLQNTVYLLNKAKIEEINLAEGQLNERWTK
jgi:hypothetical protein